MTKRSYPRPERYISDEAVSNIRRLAHERRWDALSPIDVIDLADEVMSLRAQLKDETRDHPTLVLGMFLGCLLTIAIVLVML